MENAARIMENSWKNHGISFLEMAGNPGIGHQFSLVANEPSHDTWLYVTWTRNCKLHDLHHTTKFDNITQTAHLVHKNTFKIITHLWDFAGLKLAMIECKYKLEK